MTSLPCASTAPTCGLGEGCPFSPSATARAIISVSRSSGAFAALFLGVMGGISSVRLAGLHQLTELGHELVDVSKRPVNARKANVGYLVRLAQAGHRFLADDRRADFFLAAILQI